MASQRNARVEVFLSLVRHLAFAINSSGGIDGSCLGCSKLGFNLLYIQLRLHQMHLGLVELSGRQ